jgi:hypothetical protein
LPGFGRHTKSRDSFIEPANWPDEREIARLKATYGWHAEAVSLPEPSLNPP